MVKRLISIFLFISTLAFGVDEEVSYFNMYANKTHIKIPFYRLENHLVNDICKNNISSCLAYRALKNPMKETKMAIGNLSNISAAYCKSVLGSPLILNKSGGESLNFCAFSDNSIISSWSLYKSYQAKLKKSAE